MSRVVELNDIGALPQFADAWSRLLCRTPRASFFHSLDWLTTYWRHFGHDQKLRVLIVFNGDALTGIVPLVVRREHKRIATLRVLTYPLHDWGSFYGPIGANPAAALGAALQHIRETSHDWDMIDLRWVPPEAQDLTDRALQTAGFHARQHVWKRIAVIDTIGTWDDYLTTRKQKFRNSIRRYERRLGELGGVTFERFRPLGTAAGEDDPRWEDFQQCVALAARSWQGNSSDGTTLSHGSVSHFLRDAHQAAVRRGCLDLNLLRLDGRLVAFAYNYQFDGAIHGLRIGYDPDYAKVGAGKVLWAKTFRDSFQRGDHWYDVGPDSLEIKQNWLTHVVPVYAYAYYRPLAPRTQLVRLGQLIRDYRSAPAKLPTGTELVPLTHS
jgi:CelD/BcsL family acetyltransferase involved in cellulose biosynthesis